MRYTSLLLSVVLLFGCGNEPTIDEEQPKESMSEIKSNLSSERLQEFEEAWETIVKNRVSGIMEEAFSGGLSESPNQNQMSGELLSRFDGMTAQEIITYADSVERAKEREERRQALQEIQELKKQKQRAEQASEKLSKFEVDRSRFYKREGALGNERPIVEMTVTNGTDAAISRAYFNAELRSPDREVPWLEETFNYEISGGIEPGETQEWELAPNRFSDWGDVEERSDMVLIVDPYRIDGPDGEPLYEADWDEEDEERLQTLREEYDESTSE